MPRADRYVTIPQEDRMTSGEKNDFGCKASEKWNNKVTPCRDCPFPEEDCLDGKDKRYIEGYIRAKEHEEATLTGMALAMEVKYAMV